MVAANQSSKLLRSLVLTVALLAITVGLLVAVTVPNFVRKGPSKLNGIINTLRQIDAAKQQWAFERGITNIAQVTK
jgi:hypothetical protein